jgi:hypothetical protein
MHNQSETINMSTTRKILILSALLNFSASAYAQAWDLLATSTDNNAITADDEALYALKDSGNVWRYDGNSWELVDNGTETKQIVANTYLYVLKNSGNIWLRQNGQWRMIDSGVATRQIAARGTAFGCSRTMARYGTPKAMARIGHESNLCHP